jgi:hypothetical protein
VLCANDLAIRSPDVSQCFDRVAMCQTTVHHLRSRQHSRVRGGGRTGLSQRGTCVLGSFASSWPIHGAPLGLY